MLSQSRLREVAEYDPDTGIMRWRRNCGHASAGKAMGTWNEKGYLLCFIDGHRYRVHRLVWLYEHGYMPPHEVDHINGIRHDNRLANLRLVTRAENSRNRGFSSHNTSGVTGVHWENHSRRWVAEIYVNRRRIKGRFKDKAHAVAAREQAERDYGFHENHGKPRPKKIPGPESEDLGE